MKKKIRFIDMFDFVVCINEVFDTKIEPKSWITNEDGVRIGHLIIDDADYTSTLSQVIINLMVKNIIFLI